MKGIVNSQDGLRLRLSPSIGAEILGTMIYKTPVEVISNVNGWYEIAAIANGVIFNQTFWANSKYITIQKPLSYTLGIHFINNHEDARSMLSRGLKAALVMNGKTSAQKLAQDFPKATIVYRRDYQAQSAQQFFNDLEVSADDLRKTS